MKNDLLGIVAGVGLIGLASYILFNLTAAGNEIFSHYQDLREYRAGTRPRWLAIQPLPSVRAGRWIAAALAIGFFALGVVMLSESIPVG